jgi:hypothetical protein
VSEHKLAATQPVSFYPSYVVRASNCVRAQTGCDTAGPFFESSDRWVSGRCWSHYALQAHTMPDCSEERRKNRCLVNGTLAGFALKVELEGGLRAVGRATTPRLCCSVVSLSPGRTKRCAVRGPPSSAACAQWLLQPRH